jgi:hypothetical protein
MGLLSVPSEFRAVNSDGSKALELKNDAGGVS